MKTIQVKGARVHNLKNIDVEIPRDQLVVITGLSGSGKSSLAFDTIYAEGQRRYVESLSTYARQFLQLMEKPDVDSIDGLSPAISIDQKTASRNPRSTVGTVTEIYDYLRLLFAKIGHPHCPECNSDISKLSASQMVEIIAEMPEGKRIMILAPVIRDRKGEHIKVFDKIKKEGFVRLRVDGEIHGINEEIELDPKKKHTIEIVVDRLVVKNFKKKIIKLKSGQEIEEKNEDRSRLADSIETALKHGEGIMIILDADSDEEQIFAEHFACDTHGVISLPEVVPRSFSFNSPHGACPDCHGLGTKLKINSKLVIPNPRLTIAEGAILPWSISSMRLNWYNNLLREVGKKHGFDINTPVGKLTENQIDIILNGTGDAKYKAEYTGQHSSYETETTYEGVIPNLERRYHESESDYIRKNIERFMEITTCETCEGKRLRPEILAITVLDKSIIDATEMSIEDAEKYFKQMIPDGKNKVLSDSEYIIARLIIQEILNRLQFLKNVGLSYLTMNRTANTLSGGEAQRIRLATQIGSSLQGVLYVLDEPSIGLHQRDNNRLITTLEQLRDLGNTVIVVEHDEETIRKADYVLDIGPGAGKHGGEVIFAGSPKEIEKNKKSLTGQYLSGEKEIPIPKERRKGSGKYLEIIGAQENNLKNVGVKIPLNTFVGITGVSGSGKSSLINYILCPVLSTKLNRAKQRAGKYKEIKGTEHLDKIISIDQSPIGRTPRSNPATYTGVFSDIRELFASITEAKLRGYREGRFSFNVKGGRCESCQGEGMVKIEMHFLPDVYVPCEVCKGKRYNSETLEITWHGKNISDVLNMTVEEALEFFEAIPQIKNKLGTLNSVGLGYIMLGQSATTLSGGEAQRVKLSTELAKRSTGNTIYVLDEPTTGLHFEDVKKLLGVLQALVDKGNTVLTIEHNLDVIKSVDHVIDLGPEGGDEGGEIICTGTPEEVAKCKKSYTGQFLSKMLK
ncbi:excinuclease ABC subunit UvrA [Patescibacteria group bacterium]|nr:excinuclease ABC subunit UvrA [Patescibacteria group bacterium]MBU1682762.1 excinuclease ABC subunit UvrA [Patescibacteria group bacterium]MBU1934606.1 excinuclease ABC subunit UvrA [Patescibacteria group bacterium]